MFNKRTWNAYVERRKYCRQVYASSTDSLKKRQGFKINGSIGF